MHVYRWDLDKTYLDTDFESVRALIRTALEPASRKRHIPGAPALLRALTVHDPTCRVSILSGSPTQMRAVLEEKLALDGVRFDVLVLKDNLGNLRRGRIRAVRGQVGYKLPRLFQQRVGLGPVVRETLFGDDAEVDAVVYSVYADAIAGRIGESEVARVMEAGGAYDDTVEDALRALRQIGRADAVEDIFIHLDRGTPVGRFHVLGPRVIPIFSWLQAAIVLWTRGRLGPGGVAEVARACSDEGGLGERAIAGIVQDLVRRRRVDASRVFELLDQAEGLGPVAPVVRKSLERLGEPPPSPPPPSIAEYLAFLRAAHA